MGKRRLPVRERLALGRRLREARRAMRLSQPEAARRLRLESFQTLANYEQGRCEVPLALVPAVTELYRISLQDLFGAPTKGVDLPTRLYYAHLHAETEELIQELLHIGARLRKLYDQDHTTITQRNGQGRP